MTDRPINLHAHEVNAILEGRQTQLRRVLKAPIPPSDADRVFTWFAPPEVPVEGIPNVWAQSGLWADQNMRGNKGGYKRYLGPAFCRPGDRLWVREAWTYINHGSERGLEICIGYNADGDSLPNRPSIIVPDSWGDRADCWVFRPRRHSSIHMPRWASRLTLIVTDVRVQRLQEISIDDARAEGLVPADAGGVPCWRGYAGAPVTPSASVAFHDLWDSINAKRPGCAWDDNPWVVALTFRAIPKNIDQIGDGDDH